MPNFSPEGYVELVAELLEKKYEVRGFHDADPNRAHLILRHDVDFDLTAAVQMAELESANGWSAQYFVLVRSEFYNLYSKHSSTALLRLVELGHGVGLHFDARLYPPPPPEADDLRQGLAEEIDVVELLAKRPIDIFSLHRPQPDLLSRDFSIEGRLNAYAPRFTEQMGYCSDSRGGWHHGHPNDHAAVRAHRGLQLLTHPIWWMDGDNSARETLERVLDRRYHGLETEAGVHCSSYSPRGESEMKGHGAP